MGTIIENCNSDFTINILWNMIQILMLDYSSSSYQMCTYNNKASEFFLEFHMSIPA